MLTLSYLGIHATRIDDWAEFAGVIGFEVEQEAGRLLLRLDDKRYRFAIIPAAHDDIAFVGYECAEREDWEVRTRRLREAGVPVVLAGEAECRERHVAALARFADPDGLVIELAQGLSHVGRRRESTWPTHGFETQAGFGHALVTTRDCEEARSFYERFLGARLSDCIELGDADAAVRIAFLNFNARHHSLALMQTATPTPRRLQHVMVQMKDLTDLGPTYERLAASRFRLTASLGQHPNDRSLSFYCATPSKLWMEIGWNSVQIDAVDGWQPEIYRTTSLWGHKPMTQP